MRPDRRPPARSGCRPHPASPRGQPHAPCPPAAAGRLEFRTRSTARTGPRRRTPSCGPPMPAPPASRSHPDRPAPATAPSAPRTSPPTSLFRHAPRTPPRDPGLAPPTRHRSTRTPPGPPLRRAHARLPAGIANTDRGMLARHRAGRHTASRPRLRIPAPRNTRRSSESSARAPCRLPGVTRASPASSRSAPTPRTAHHRQSGSPQMPGQDARCS
jgi:hypothetical protein